MLLNLVYDRIAIAPITSLDFIFLAEFSELRLEWKSFLSAFSADKKIETESGKELLIKTIRQVNFVIVINDVLLSALSYK